MPIGVNPAGSINNTASGGSDILGYPAPTFVANTSGSSASELGTISAESGRGSFADTTQTNDSLNNQATASPPRMNSGSNPNGASSSATKTTAGAAATTTSRAFSAEDNNCGPSPSRIALSSSNHNVKSAPVGPDGAVEFVVDGRHHDDDSDCRQPILSDSLNSPSSSGSSSDMSFSVLSHPKITWWRLAFMAYAYTSGGPFGLESLVRAGGPFWSLVTVFVIPAIYVIPSICSVAELSAMMPSNHGSILWVTRAFGPFAGFYNGVISVITNAVDLSVYPVFFSDYLTSQFAPDDFPDGYKLMIRYACILIGTTAASMPAARVGDLSMFFALLIVGPVLVGCFAGVGNVAKTDWSATPAHVDYGLLLSTGLWSYSGTDSFGSVAGEVQSTSVYVKGLAASMVMDMATSSLFPLLVICRYGGHWKDGSLVEAFDTVLPGLGNVIAVVGAISSLGLYCSALVIYSRQMWGVAQLGWLPKIFTYTHPTTRAPIAANIANALVACIGAFADFSLLVKLEFVAAAPAYLLPCFVTLRYKEPDTERPIRIPGGLPVAWLISGLPYLVLATVIGVNLMDNLKVTLIAAAVNVLVAILYLITRHACGIRVEDVGDRFSASSAEPSEQL